MVVLPGAQVNLSERVKSESLDDVDHHRNVDSVPRCERDLEQGRAASGVLAAHRLHHVRQEWKERTEKRSGHELGNPPSFMRGAGVRTIEEALHEGEPRVLEQWADKTKHEVRPEVAYVCIDVDHDLAARDSKCLPQGFTLPRARSEAGCDLGVYMDLGAGALRTLAGVVGRARIDHQ